MIGRVISLCCSLIVVLGAVPAAQGQIPPPEFSKSALLNGMEVFFLPTSSARCNFLLAIRNGAAFDPQDKWGVTHLTTQMMLEQTTRRTGEQLRQDLALLGAELEVRVDWDAIYFSGSAPAQRLGDALNVLAEIVIRPDFREDTFNQVRARELEAVKGRASSAATRTQEAFLAELFGRNPYGHTVYGTAETLQNLLLNDAKIQYRRLFLPNQAQLAVYFPGDHTALFSSLARAWGSWVRGDPAPFTFRQAEPLEESQAVLLDSPTTDQGWLRLGTLAVARNQPQFYELEILKHYLTLSLTDWARQVTSQSQIQASVKLEARRMPGYLQLTLKAPGKQLVDYAFKFRELLAQLQQGKLDPDRFTEAKELAFLTLRQQLEQPKSRLEQLLQSRIYGLGISFFTTYGIRLNRINESRFQSTINEVLSPSKLLLVAAGDAAFLEAKLQGWGQVRILN